MKRTRNTTVYLITILSLIMLSVSRLSFTVEAQEAPKFDMEQLRKDRPIQQRTPIIQYTERRSDEDWVPPSITRKLEPGQRVDHEPVEDVDRIIMQRLTERTYWVWSNVYSLTMYVGDEGVLLIDAPETFPFERFLREEMQEVTTLPVTTVVYSHTHVDHVAGTKVLLGLLDTELRIIGSEASTREIGRHKNMIPMPTEVIPDGYSTFTFEGETFRYVTPVNVAHTGADSYTITPDGVAHVVDFFYPGILPLAQTSGVKDLTGYINFLRAFMGEDWDFVNLGHDNVGYKSDLAMTLEYHQDLFAAAYEFWPGFGAEGLQPFRGQWAGLIIRNLFDQVTTAIAEAQREKWGHLPQWEVAWDHAHMVLWDFALNWDYEGARRDGDRSRAIPDFTPIPPPR